MDYFNDLLVSYDLLKKRKFRLTLIEAGGDDDNSVLATIKQVATGKRSADKAQHNGVSLWETDLDDPGNSEIVGSVGYSTITITQGNKSQVRSGLPPKQQEKVDLIMAKLRGGGVELDDDVGDVEPEQPNPNEALVPLAEELQGTIDRWFPGGALESDLAPGLLRNKVNSREQKMANIALNKAAGKKQGVGVRGDASKDTSITDRLLSSTSLPLDKAESGLKLANAILKGVEDIHDGNPITADALRRMSEGVEMTGEGVLLDGVFMDYRTKADGTNDLLTNAANQVNDYIKKHNSENCSGFEKGSDVQKECTVQEIKVPLDDARELLTTSDRGLLIEEVDIIRDLAVSIQGLKTKGKPVKELEKRLKSLYSSALKRGTAEQVKNTFEEGLSLSAKKIISDSEGGDSVVITENAINYLVAEEGMSEAGAYELVSSAALAGDGGSRALLVLISTSRGFSKSLNGLDIVDAKVMGTTDSTLKGQKTDEERTVTPSSFTGWRDNLGKNMGPLERKLEEASKLCDDPDVGLLGLGEEDKEGNITLRTESKALTSTKTSRVKMGEGNTSRVTDLLNGKSHSSKEMDFVNATVTRIDNSFKNSNNKDFKDVSIHAQAKSFQSSLDSRMRSVRGPLANKPVLGADGKKIEGTGHQAVDAWLNKKGTKTLKNDKRAKLAKQWLQTKNPTAEQSEAIKKVEADIEQNVIADKLRSSTDSEGNLSGDGLGYVLFRLGLEGGSLKENHKDVKGYSDGKQLSGLINSSVFGTISMIAQGKGVATQKGNTTTLRADSGEVMMRVSFERGQAVVSVGRDALSSVGASEEANESADKATLQEFLEGQRELLDRLLTQTS